VQGINYEKLRCRNQGPISEFRMANRRASEADSETASVSPMIKNGGVAEFVGGRRRSGGNAR
jgi:hypothetical protein